MLRSMFLSILMMMMIAGGAVAGEWAETVKVSGDLRYRHENIDETGKEMRNRHRVRGRIGIDAAVEENLSVHFRLVSGSDDPASTNQTLDDAFTTKSIGLDRASFVWTRTESNLKVMGGKMGLPFIQVAKSELIWDGDLSPEGLAAAWKTRSGSATFFVNAAGLWIDERESAKNAAMLGAQAGLTHATDGVTVTVGGSLFGYCELSGPLYDDSFFGNSNDGTIFGTEFTLVEIFGSLGFKAGDTPVTVFADVVTNSDADADEQGYLFGVKLNKAKKPGSWALGYDYRELQADAVVGAFTNSDFGGGGTDAKGHSVSGQYQLSPKSQLALTYFMNTKGLDNGVDYNRLQADLNIKF